jgi:hypothetical protein
MKELEIQKAIKYTVFMPFKKGFIPWNKGNKSVRDPNLYRRNYLARHPWARYWTNSKGRAGKKGLEHKLSVADFKELWLRNEAFKLKSPSIDRIDPTKGYIQGNCRFIERSENCRLGSLGKPTSKKHDEQARKNLSNWYKKKQNA